jgi:uncharacterized protein YndB with AHSA1/START domain
MSVAGRTEGETSTIRLVRTFDAPRELVFREWISAEKVAGWFAPDGYTVTRCAMDARPGGAWRVEFESGNGERHTEFGVFESVEPPKQLVFTLTQSAGPGRTGPLTRVSVTFVERNGITEMHFEQTGYRSGSMRDANAEGWSECFAKLERQLARQTDQVPARAW